MRRIPIEMILVLVLLGIAIGIVWARWMAMEAQIANHSTRIASLEDDRTKYLQLKAFARAVGILAGKFLEKVSFGLIKAK